jgi:inhibitor of cysteine peptidase
MTVALTEADAGKSIEVGEGEEIVVVLEENPTTGYRWQVDRTNGILELEGDSYTPDPEMRFGSGGKRELRFRRTGPGTGRLELKLWQEWEGESSVTKRFGVEILPSPDG